MKLPLGLRLRRGDPAAAEPEAEAEAESLHFDAGEVRVGRGDDADLRLPDAPGSPASRQHARLFQDEKHGGWWVEDLGSRNGTFLNGLRIEGPTLFHPGDTLRFGPGGPLFRADFAAPPHRGASGAGGRAHLLLAGAAAAGLLLVAAALFLGGDARGGSEDAGASGSPLTGPSDPGAEMPGNGLPPGDASGHGEPGRGGPGLPGEAAETGGDARDGTGGEGRGGAEGGGAGATGGEAGGGAGGRVGTAPEPGAAPVGGASPLSPDLARPGAPEPPPDAGWGDPGAEALAPPRALSPVQEALAREARRAVALVWVEDAEGKVSTGTAFALRDDGILVTVRHLLLADPEGPRPRRIGVQFSDSDQVWEARLEGVSTEVDLAALRLLTLPAEQIPRIASLNLRPDTLGPGTPLLVLGFPDGGRGEEEGRGLARPVLTPGVLEALTPAQLRVLGAGASGASGSPVLDASGGVVGVVYGGVASAPRTDADDEAPDEHRLVAVNAVQVARFLARFPTLRP